MRRGLRFICAFSKLENLLGLAGMVRNLPSAERAGLIVSGDLSGDCNLLVAALVI